MTKSSACVITLGCRVNQYESDAIMQELLKRGVEIKQSSDICDIYIINTCSVTAESDRKSRQIIRRCISKNPNAVIIVTGCYAQINPDAVLAIDGVDFVCGNNAKSIIPDKAISLLGKKSDERVFMPDIWNSRFDKMYVGAPLTRTRAFIKIEDGCDSKCAYCIIPHARGNVRSNDKDSIIKEVKNIVSEGCFEVVLTGIETAAYGKDFKNGYSLADLLCEINEIDGLKRIRLGSLDPASITRDFTDKIKNLDKVMPHFHISMQSGCTKTLNAMRRKYNIEMAKDNLDYIRKSIPNVMFSADVITGFPGESDDDFQKTVDFFKEQRFLHLHIFPYSKRKGTEAEGMPYQVDECVKKERLHTLSMLEKALKKDVFDKIVSDGTELEILFESFDGKYAIGHTENFIEVKAEAKRSYSGEFKAVKPISHDGEYVYGTII